MSRAHDLGRRGEQIAAQRFQAQGWTIVGRNFRLGHREIDLVVRRRDTVAFVEVKTRASREHGHPLEAINAAKRREIERVARAWVARHGRPNDLYRFDAVAIIWEPGGSPIVEHIPDAWRL